MMRSKCCAQGLHLTTNGRKWTFIFWRQVALPSHRSTVTAAYILTSRNVGREECEVEGAFVPDKVRRRMKLIFMKCVNEIYQNEIRFQ